MIPPGSQAEVVDRLCDLLRPRNGAPPCTRPQIEALVAHGIGLGLPARVILCVIRNKLNGPPRDGIGSINFFHAAFDREAAIRADLAPDERALRDATGGASPRVSTLARAAANVAARFDNGWTDELDFDPAPRCSSLARAIAKGAARIDRGDDGI